MNTAIGVNGAVIVVTAGPLQQILSAVKQLQITTHLLLIDLSYPATLSKFYGMLM
jgi:hypothetical protein